MKKKLLACALALWACAAASADWALSEDGAYVIDTRAQLA